MRDFYFKLGKTRAVFVSKQRSLPGRRKLITPADLAWLAAHRSAVVLMTPDNGKCTETSNLLWRGNPNNNTSACREWTRFDGARLSKWNLLSSWKNLSLCTNKKTQDTVCKYILWSTDFLQSELWNHERSHFSSRRFRWGCNLKKKIFPEWLSLAHTNTQKYPRKVSTKKKTGCCRKSSFRWRCSAKQVLKPSFETQPYLKTLTLSNQMMTSTFCFAAIVF